MTTLRATGVRGVAYSLGIVVFAFVSIAPQVSAYEGTRVSLRDLGVLQIAAHDLFLVDRDIEENLENDKLDLSTIFEHGDAEIAIGGEIRNSENVAVFSVASSYAAEYLEMVEHGTSKDDARARVVRHFHGDLTNAARNMTGGRLPEYYTGSTTMTDDLAYRVIHDLLPGSVVVDGVVTPILSPSLFRHALTDSELWAQGAFMDGAVDEVFRNITFFTPEGLVVIDLIERDHSFGDQFNTDFSFQHFLDESADGTLDADEDSTRLIRNLIAKGMGNYYAYMDALKENPGLASTTVPVGEKVAEAQADNSGTDGEDTADGTDGTESTDGEDTTDGTDGTDGTEGADGGAGNDGTDGTDGTVVVTPPVEAVAEPVIVLSTVQTTPEPPQASPVRDVRSTRSTR